MYPLSKFYVTSKQFFVRVILSRSGLKTKINNQGKIEIDPVQDV